MNDIEGVSKAFKMWITCEITALKVLAAIKLNVNLLMNRIEL